MKIALRLLTLSFINVLGFSVSFAQSSVSESLPPTFQAAEGKTFSAAGPNCFATALKLTGVTRAYRGMDEPEFSKITKMFCHKVSDPRIGDIGVFEKPGFGFIHAYAYVSDTLVMQKPGVDYMGKTPISIQPLEGVRYTYLASPECRRYSKDISECANDNYYLRCSAVSMQGHPWAEEQDQVIASVEAHLDMLLSSPQFGENEQKLISQLVQTIAAVEVARISQSDIPRDLNELIAARLISLKKQLQFLQQKL